MTGGETTEPTMRYAVDKKKIFPMVKDLLGAGHGKNILQYLGHQRREYKSDQQQPGLWPPAEHHQQDDHRHGEDPVPQIRKGDKKVIKQGLMKWIQEQKAGSFTLCQQQDQPHQKKEAITEKKIAVGHNDCPQLIHPVKLLQTFH